jgi:beta-xylosidase
MDDGVVTNDQGEAGRPTTGARPHVGRTHVASTHGAGRRMWAWSALVVLVVAGVAATAAGVSSSRADAMDRPVHVGHHGGPATAPGPHGPRASVLTSATAPLPTSTAWAPGTQVASGSDQSDPFLTTAGGRYLLLTSGSSWPRLVNVPVSTSTDFVHWTPPVDALPVLPAWAAPGFTWAPDLHRFGSLYALYFTAMVAGYSPTSQCIGSAFSTSPTGPFTAQPTPFICQLDQGGDIDPRVFVDADGSPWMVWKTDQNIGGADTPTKLWSERLSADGTRLVGSPSFLMSPDEAWQGTIVEAPDLVQVDGAYWIVYSGNWYNQPAYAVGAARCDGPAGPCRDVSPTPLLASNLQGQGPGEASVFHDDAGIWLLYSPWRSFAPRADIPPRPIYITRLGFGASGPYLATGPLPSAVDLLARPVWSPTP